MRPLPWIRHSKPYGVAGRIVNVALAVFVAFAAVAHDYSRAAEPKRLLVLGDSLVAGYKLDAAESFPARLEAALARAGHAVRVIGAGVSGDTTAGGRTRLSWALSSTGPDGPDGVIVELGANDGLRGLDPASTEANLDAILAELGRRKIPALLTGMRAPRNLGREYVERFDRLYWRVAKKHDVLFYPFFLEGVATVRSFNLDDAIHPNAKGVEEIVRRILPTVVRLLDKM